MLSKIKHKKVGFTLVETLLVCSVFAIMVTGIILAINRSYIFMNNIRMQVRATNFAREGVEMMFNIRDTNRRKYSGEKDKHWLYYKYLDQPQNIGNGIYVLSEKVNATGDWEISLKPISASPSSLKELNGGSPIFSDDDFYSDDGFWGEKTYSSSWSDEKIRNMSKITFTGSYQYMSGYYDDGVRTGKIITGDMQELLGSETDFYRIVRVFGVYCKNDTNPNQLMDNNHCKNDSDPKEMRFCVKVFYRTSSAHSVELCSIMTNFEE